MKELCHITGNHPLALELFASRLQSEFIKPSDYLKDIQSDPLGRLSDEKKFDVFLDAASASLAEVLHHSYASLDEELVDRYFLLMCCFAPYGINEELIVQAYDDLAKAEGPSISWPIFHSSVANFLIRSRSIRLSLSSDEIYRNIKTLTIRASSSRSCLASCGHTKIISPVRRCAGKNLISMRRSELAQENELWEACANLHEYEADIEVGIQEQIESLDKAYQIIEQHLPQQKRRLPGLRLRLGKAHRTAGQLNEALDDFNKADVLYREIGDVDPAEAASLRFELGDTYLALGRYAEAEKTLSDALNLALTDLDNSAPEVLQLRQALARHALYLGDYDTAEAGFTEILGDRKKFYIAQPDATSAAGLASAHADLSRLALARAHYADAIRAAEDALAITKEYHDESDPDCSHLYLLLGTIHYEFGDYGLAEEQLDKARQDFLTTFGEWHPSYARALIALGEVYRKQGKIR